MTEIEILENKIKEYKEKLKTLKESVFMYVNQPVVAGGCRRYRSSHNSYFNDGNTSGKTSYWGKMRPNLAAPNIINWIDNIRARPEVIIRDNDVILTINDNNHISFWLDMDFVTWENCKCYAIVKLPEFIL